MNETEVRQRVATIAAIGDSDPEAAHSAEDGLWFNVLEAISLGLTDDPAALAQEALKTHDLSFPRWCA